MAELAVEDAVLLMDPDSAHVTNDVVRLVTGARVRVITFPPYTT
jgi:hypothetical protein